MKHRTYRNGITYPTYNEAWRAAERNLSFAAAAETNPATYCGSCGLSNGNHFKSCQRAKASALHPKWADCDCSEIPAHEVLYKQNCYLCSIGVFHRVCSREKPSATQPLNGKLTTCCDCGDTMTVDALATHDCLTDAVKNNTTLIPVKRHRQQPFLYRLRARFFLYCLRHRLVTTDGSATVLAQILYGTDSKSGALLVAMATVLLYQMGVLYKPPTQPVQLATESISEDACCGGAGCCGKCI